MFLLACGSLRADRAVMFFAFSNVLSVASFQSFVPHSFNSATFSTAHKRSSFTSLHEPTHRHSAICLQSSSNGFVLQSKNTNPSKAIAGSYCSIPFQQSFRSVQSLPLPLPTLMQKKHASPAVNGRRLPPSFFGLLQPPPLLRSQAARTHSYRSPFRFSPFQPSAWPTLAQGCFTCVSAQDSIPIYKTTLITFYHLLFVPNLQSY